jgi:cysteine-rich repeat protein
MPWMTRLITIASFALAACAGQPDASVCATGITCPEGTKCAAAQMICITNDCGDGVQQSTEKCDDGNIIDGDGCAANCGSREICGDGVLNSAAGELCDLGDTLGGDGCAADCRSIEICGNMIRDVGEACDDGNTIPGDGCSGNCKSAEICGNNIVDVNEKCDDGGLAGGCNDDCQGGTGCGDGAIDEDGTGAPIEECDDGNMVASDDCNLCNLTRCGDGVRQLTGSHLEQCDGTDLTGVGGGTPGETMMCNLDCTTASCGDGKLNLARGEQCDDTNSVDTDACKNDCKLNFCGDGVEGGPNEACDDGMDSMMCDLDCTIRTCGDGYVNLVFGEECDSGAVNTATCDANCTIPVCGDGTPNMAAGEECDDMNVVNTDDCLDTCEDNDCGDGYRDLQGPQTEACDDGNMMDELSCTYGTQSCMTCNMTCSMVVPRTGNVCGDGVPLMPQEMCDDGNRTTETNCPYGTQTCTSFCRADCGAPLNLTGPFCGDGMTQATFGEACDDRSPTQSCGRCDNSCNVFHATAVAATGLIIASSGSPLNDNDRFTINDGFGVSRTFEFDSNSMLSNAAFVRIAYTNADSATTVRDSIKGAINTSGLGILATDAGSSGVRLTNDEDSALGNQTITDNVGTSSVFITGMSGGLAGDCPNTTPCNDDDDCRSRNCSSGTCMP